MAQLRRRDNDEEDLFPRLNGARKMVGAPPVEQELAALGRHDILDRRRAALRAFRRHHPD
jgi:hypothetical protein